MERVALKQMRWKILATISVISLLVLPGAVRAELELVPDAAAQFFFAGEGGRIHAAFRNPDEALTAVRLRTHVYQACSATLIPLAPAQDWKRLEILPGQTVLESIFLTFPTVKTGTRFLVRWLDDNDRVLGTSEVMVYPTNLL